MFKKRINFLIIGAQKCGTSSFAAYLKGHPQIELAKKKELHYFNFNWEKGINWYHQYFGFKPNRIQGEATPYYLMHPEAPLRAKQYNPKLKLIALLRNPTERAYSHYQMNIARGFDNVPFLKALEVEETRLKNDPNPHVIHAASQHASYKTRGLYAKQLNAWLRLFPKEQLLPINYHTFFDNPISELQSVFKFLELAPYFPHTNTVHLNHHPAKEPIPQAAEQRLNHYFSEPNKQLKHQFGISF